MKDISILIFEIIIAIGMAVIGLSGWKVFFIQGARSATIVLGILGMLLCTLSVGKFIASVPAHPLSILGYIIGIIAMLTFLTQVFKWNVPIISNSQMALIVMAVAIIAKSVIARFAYFIVK